jgi:protein-S-isoprenylcysteine O-methyltransferase Ste14
MIKLVIFVAVTAVLAYFTRGSIRSPRHHGFYRFLAWEAILGLLLLNSDYWQIEPPPRYEPLSALLLVVSIYLVAHGTYLLRAYGRADGSRTDQALRPFERTTRLVTTGLFRYIRHPLYSSLLFLAWGMFLKDTSWLAGALTLAATVSLVVTGKTEERECVQYFGSPYREYMQRTRMFIPLLF